MTENSLPIFFSISLHRWSGASENKYLRLPSPIIHVFSFSSFFNCFGSQPLYPAKNLTSFPLTCLVSIRKLKVSKSPPQKMPLAISKLPDNLFPTRELLNPKGFVSLHHEEYIHRD